MLTSPIKSYQLLVPEKKNLYNFPGIPTTIKTKGVNITTIVYLRVLIIQTGSTIILMVVEAQGFYYRISEKKKHVLKICYHL